MEKITALVSYGGHSPIVIARGEVAIQKFEELKKEHSGYISDDKLHIEGRLIDEDSGGMYSIGYFLNYNY